MSPFYAARYRELLAELLFRRECAPEGLPDAEEAKFAAALDRCWQAMTQEEQAEIERELAADAPPTAPDALALADRVVAAGASVIPREAA